MKYLRKENNEKDNSIKLTLLYAFIVLFNLLTVQSGAGILLTLIEALYVLIILSKRKTAEAFFWHTIFTITCISATGASGMDFDNTVMFSYARLKIAGPIGLSYVVSCMILIASMSKKTEFSHNSLFYKLTILVAFLLIQGFLIGAIGVLFSDYYPDYWINYTIYSAMVLINCLCFLKNYGDYLINKVYHHSLPLLVGACLSSVIAYYLFGVKTTYGGLKDVVLCPDICYYGVLLLFLVVVIKKKFLAFIGLICFTVIMVLGLGGKNIIGAAIAFLFIFYYVSFSKKTIYTGVVKKKYIILTLVIIAGAGLFVYKSIEGQFLGAMKFDQALSLFFEIGDISNMSTSPYIRVASFLNIVDNGLSSPFNLLFGHGYGGYFTDSLNLLYSKVDMYGTGGFDYDSVMKHKLPTAHDTFVVVPLLNGFVGLFALLVVVVKYIKKIKCTPYAFTAILWLLLVYYFNTQLAITGMFFLFAAEYDLERINKFNL